MVYRVLKLTRFEIHCEANIRVCANEQYDLRCGCIDIAQPQSAALQGVHRHKK